MSAAEPREGDPRFDLLDAVQAALLPHVAALEAADDPSLDAELYEPAEPAEHTQPHEGCDCAACVLYVAEIDVIVDELRAQAIQHREDRAHCGLDEEAFADPDPCPLALIARGGGVSERRGARYARTPAARAEEPAVAVLRLRARHRPLVAVDVVAPGWRVDARAEVC